MNSRMMRRRLRNRRKTQIAGPPQLIAATFGLLTLAGAGGIAVSGTEVSAGDPDSHWEVNLDGHLVPTATGEGNLSGTYNIVLNNGQPVMITMAALESSVRSEQEIEDALQATSAGGGISIRLRNTGQIVPTGPIDLGRGKDFSSEVVLTGEAGARIADLLFIDVTGLRVFELECHETTGSPSKSVISVTGASDIHIDYCHLHGVDRDPFGDYSDGGYSNTLYGVNTASALGSEPLGVKVTRCLIEHVGQGMALVAQDASGVVVEDNEVRFTYTDAMQVTKRSVAGDAPLRVRRNFLHSFLGLGSDVGDPHVDAIQISSGETFNMTNVEITQNIIKTDTTKSRANNVQGINLFNAGFTVTLVDPLIAGNIVITGGTNAMVISALNGGRFASNIVAVAELGAVDNGVGAIELGTVASSGTIYVYRNIVEQLSLQGAATYDTGDNVVMGDEGGTISYASVFDGPTFTAPISRADVLSRYARKAGGPADLAGLDAGPLGSGFGTYGDVRDPTGWTMDPAYYTFALAIPAPPVTPTHWWDFTDAAQRTMGTGNEIAEVDDKQGSHNLLFAPGDRPSLINGRVAHFQKDAVGTLSSTLSVTHNDNTVMFIGHIGSDNHQGGLFSVLGGGHYIVGVNAAGTTTPSPFYILSDGDKQAAGVTFPWTQFATPYQEAGVMGNAAYVVASGFGGILIDNSEMSETLPATGGDTTDLVALFAWIDASSNKCHGRFNGVLYFDRELSQAEIDQMLDWARQYYGAFDNATQDRVIVADGDSITHGYGPAEPSQDNWVAQMGSTYNVQGTRLSNRAINGDTISADTTAGRVVGALAAYSVFTRKDVVVAKGSNDIFSNNNPSATVIANLTTYLTSIANAANTPDNIYVCTIIDRGGDDPDRAAVNAHILGLDGTTIGTANVPVTAIDLAVDPRLDDADDATYITQSDDIHLTQAGAAAYAELIYGVLFP